MKENFVQLLSEFHSLDYSMIFPDKSSNVSLFYSYFTHPIVPFLSVFIYYTISKQFFAAIRKTFNIQPKSSGLQMITILHSSILAIYSGWTFLNSAKIVVPLISKHGFYETLCDAKGFAWSDSGLGFWITHFYISKYYEFIDTW